MHITKEIEKAVSEDLYIYNCRMAIDNAIKKTIPKILMIEKEGEIVFKNINNDELQKFISNINEMIDHRIKQIISNFNEKS